MDAAVRTLELCALRIPPRAHLTTLACVRAQEFELQKSKLFTACELGDAERVYLICKKAAQARGLNADQPFLLNSTRVVADLSTGEVVTLCPECPALKRGASSAPSVLSADRRHLYYIGEPPMSRDFQPLGTPYLYTFSVDTGAVESTCVMPEDFAYVKAAPRPPRSTPRRRRRPRS